jgi:putative endopeptidase
MNLSAPRLLVLSLAIATAVTACKKNDDTTTAASTSDAPARPALTLDETKLPVATRFAIGDLDANTPACVDFDGHVNGKWVAANAIPGDRSSWGVSEILNERSLAIQQQLAGHAAANGNASGIEKIVGDFWATGMDTARINAQGITPLTPQLQAIDALTDQASLTTYLRERAAEGRNPLFDFGAEADFKNSTMNIAYAMQGGLSLPDKTYYFDADKTDIRKAYEAHIVKLLQLSGVPDADAATQAKEVIALETRLAKASLSSEDLSRDVSLYYNPVTLADADKLTPNFSWTEFFKSQGVAAPAMFSLAMPGFHQEVSKMLADVPIEQWKNYLRFHAIDAAASDLSDAFVAENFEFYSKTLHGQKEMKPRWKQVLGSINSEAGEALGQMYVDVAFPPEAKAQMEVLVGNLGKALKTRIEQLSWMSDDTRKKALAKWETFTPKVGYPDKWRDWSGLATSRDSYLGNVQAAETFNYKWNLSKIGKPVDKTEWGMTPQTVNAYYNPLANEIVFPAAILQPPFFDPDADEAINYGGIGATIGHEMIHGYDDQGARFGPTGNFEEWWTPQDAAKFSALTGKLVEQFDAFEAMPGVHVNGKLTLGENIADLGGLAVAQDALALATKDKADPMTDGLTRLQRFFAGYALSWRSKDTPESLKVQLTSDPHAPARFRTNGPLTQLPAFAQAYNCKPGQPMVRATDKQVVIW